MNNIIEVTDFSEPGIEVFSQLTETQLRNRLEPEKGIFIAESPKVINVALDNGLIPISLLTDHKHLEGDAKSIVERCQDIRIYTGECDILSQIAGYKLTRGVLCAMHRPKPKTIDDICENKQRIVVLDNIADATNIGAIFRSVAALGFDGILLNSTCCDPLNRRAVRVSMGTVFQVPWAYIGNDQRYWPYWGIDYLHKLGYSIVAMALRKDSINVDNTKLLAEPRLAIVMGAEGDGLSPKTIETCDYTVCIPMKNGVDSLNVAAASAIACWVLGKREK